MAQGRPGFPTSSPCRNKGYNATTPKKPPPYIPRTGKRTNATGTRGPPYTPEPAFMSTSFHHLSIPGRLGVYEVVGGG